MIHLLTLSLAFSPWCNPCQAEIPDGYQLVWSDEFNEQGPPNPAKWTFEKGFVRNKERQWYQSNNARCEKGLLVIEARRERRAGPWHVAGSDDWRQRRRYIEYTSSSLKTEGLQEWTYGLFEICARIDARQGLWPAMWTLGRKGRWPGNGEIDIMEYYDGKILANACWLGADRRAPTWDATHVPLHKLGKDWANDFHTWRMLWTKQEIRLSVDNRLLNVIDLAEVERTQAKATNPFHQPNYLLLNLAIGGTQGGDPRDTRFPATFEADYVRVYQRGESSP